MKTNKDMKTNEKGDTREIEKGDNDMNIRLYDFGLNQLPERAHFDDAGADVYINEDYIIQGNSVEKIPLGFGIELPPNYAGFIMPRSGLSSRGITCELSPIDPGYEGEVHAIVNNHNVESVTLEKGTRVGQLVVVPFLRVNFIPEVGSKFQKFTNPDPKKERGKGAFGSSGIVGSIKGGKE